MSDEEKWHFDLFGYIILRNSVPAEDVRRMVALSDEWHSKPDEDCPHRFTRTAPGHPSDDGTLVEQRPLC